MGHTNCTPLLVFFFCSALLLKRLIKSIILYVRWEQVGPGQLIVFALLQTFSHNLGGLHPSNSTDPSSRTDPQGR